MGASIPAKTAYCKISWARSRNADGWNAELAVLPTFRKCQCACVCLNPCSVQYLFIRMFRRYWRMSLHVPPMMLTEVDSLHRRTHTCASFTPIMVAWVDSDLVPGKICYWGGDHVLVCWLWWCWEVLAIGTPANNRKLQGSETPHSCCRETLTGQANECPLLLICVLYSYNWCSPPESHQ